MTDFEALLGALDKHQVEYIIVGGVAALAHGSAMYTGALEIVYSRRSDNLDSMACALSGISPCLRDAPVCVPAAWDRATLEQGLNFTLQTSVGWLDLLGEIPGGGTYADLLPGSVELQVFEGRSRCLSLGQLIRAKRAAGRPKDLEALAELDALREEIEGL